MIGDLMPFEEAMKSLAKRKVLPTNLGTAELRALGNQFHRQNFTSAKTLIEDLLQGYKQKVEDILNPRTTTSADGSPRTEGMNHATARLQIRELQQSLGMGVTDGSGPITDLRSDARINLVLKTNVELAQGAGQKIQGNDPAVLEAFPCWELVRFTEPKGQRRNWPNRWRIAAQDSGDSDALRVLEETGRMVARKDSPIWSSLGSSRLFDDALDTDFTPLAFNSGMWMQNVAYDDAENLGLADLQTKIEPHIDWQNIFGRAA